MSASPLFISHGSPMTLIEDSAGRDFLKTIGKYIGKPKAILAISAHWMTQSPVVSADPMPETIHDFGGFPEELYQMRYPVAGSEEVAHLVFEALQQAGIESQITPKRGLDHGAWVPLVLGLPAGDIPVLQLSIQPHRNASWHYRLGQALAPLREQNILILASGSATHNLRAITRSQHGKAPHWVQAFVEWTRKAITENRREDLIHFEERAPFSRENHPTTEHFLPLFVAMGATDETAIPDILHQSIDYGVLAMDAYRFN